MNKAFKVVWSKARNCYIVVSELAKNTARGKMRSIKLGKASLAAVLAATALTVGTLAPNSALAAESSDSHLVPTSAAYYAAIGGADSNSNPFTVDNTIITSVDTSTANKIIVTMADGKKYTYNFTEVTDGKGDTHYYWVREGFGVKALTHKNHPDASDTLIDLYATGSASYENIVTSGDHTAEVTKVTTAVNNVNLDKFQFIQFAAITNSPTTDTTASQQYFIKRGENYVDVGNDNFNDNFYVLQESDFNTATQHYEFNGETIGYGNIYMITDGTTSQIGIFLDSSKASVMDSNKDGTIDTTDLANAGVSIYNGVVYGKNNEILLSGYNKTTGNWSTVWGAEVTDPNATIETMTISDFNEFMEHLHLEDVKLAEADIVTTKVTAAVDADGDPVGGGSIALVNKAGNEVPGLTVAAGGGTVDTGDTFITITDTGINADGTTSTASSLTLNTGSKVTAVTETGSDKLTGISINGKTYDLPASVDTNTTLNTSDNANALNISADGKITMKVEDTAGNVVTDTVDISDYVNTQITTNAVNATYNNSTTYIDNTIGGAIQNIENNYLSDASVTNNTLTITDGSGNKTIFTDTDTHIKAGTYNIDSNDQIVMDIVDKDGNATGSKVILNDVAKASDLDALSTTVNNINNSVTNITNNSVTKVEEKTDSNGYKTWEVTQTVNGTPQTVTITDNYINSFTQTGPSYTVDADGVETADSGKIVSTITRNDGQSYEQTVNISGYVGDKIENEARNANVTVNSQEISIETAINNNYTDIQEIKNDYVTNITENGLDINGDIINRNEHSWTITQVIDGEPQTVTIKDLNTTNESLNNVWGTNNDITITLTDTDNQSVATTLTDIAKASDMGDVTNLNTNIQNSTGSTTLVDAVNNTYTEAKKHTTVDAGSNIVVTESTNNDGGKHYTVATADDVTFTGVTSTTVNATTVNIGNNITIQEGNIDMGGNKITNVYEGDIYQGSTDVVNGGQLWQTNQNITRLGNRVDKVGAGAAALAALHPLDFDPDDKLSFAAGVGNYGGATAAAIGAFYRPNERVMFSIGGTTGNGENMVNAGVSFALGKGGKINTSRVAMTHEINDLRQQVAYLTAMVTQLSEFAGYQFTDMKPFPDTPDNHWAYEYVAKLAAEGIIEGYPSGNFDGERQMTRYEFAAMLFRALEKGFRLDTRIIDEFEPELGRLSVERIKGEQNQKNKIERVRVNDQGEDRDNYGGKIIPSNA